MAVQDKIYQSFLNRIRELSEVAQVRSEDVFTDFLTEAEQSEILSLAPGLDTKVRHFGGYPLAERKVACFSPERDPDERDMHFYFPIAILHIAPVSEKYGEALTHRDYLGAMLNLGIERKVTGDILIQGKHAWVFCLDHMVDFICESLTKVRHTEVKVSPVPDLPDLLIKGPAETAIYTPSLRLDACISKVLKMSRAQAARCLQAEKVFVNSVCLKNPSYMLKPGDLISVRGCGRFRYRETARETKKGNLRVIVEIY